MACAADGDQPQPTLAAQQDFLASTPAGSGGFDRLKVQTFPSEASTCDGSAYPLRQDDTVFYTAALNDTVGFAYGGSTLRPEIAKAMDCVLPRDNSIDESTCDGSMCHGLWYRPELSITSESSSGDSCQSFGSSDELGSDNEVDKSTEGGDDSPRDRYQFAWASEGSSDAAWPFGVVTQEDPKVRTTPLQVSGEIDCLSGCLPWLFGSSSSGRHWQSMATPCFRPSCGGVEYDFDKLEAIRELGKGSFGSVKLVHCHATGQRLALKAVSKGIVSEKILQRSLSSEKEVMKQCQSPFVVRLVATFSSTLFAYFLEEAVMGGDLYTLYSSCQYLIGSDRHASFYTACVLRALEHLHERHIVYRDLKLENVVLGTDGYGKLCDFGISRVLNPEDDFRAYTICGTVECMAPEVMLNSCGYSTAADWWSLGILLRELMDPRLLFEKPQRDADRHRSFFEKARRGTGVTDLPEEADWADVVRGLCQLEPSERVPEQADGIRRFEEQAWFSNCGFDWPAFSRRSLAAPHVPAPAGARGRESGCSTLQRSFLGAVLRDSNEVPWSEWDESFEDRIGPLISVD